MKAKLGEVLKDGGTWRLLERDLDQAGFAVLKAVLNEQQCREISGLYSCDKTFRSRVVMARHGFGLGEYKYFAYPLPAVLQELRQTLYPHLVPIANRWNTLMGIDVQYPATHDDFLARCHGAGQVRPTPLLLRYGPGDYNCLHQDLYGEHVFPLQLAILLSQPDRDFLGGEFVMTQTASAEQHATVVPLCQGDAVVFAVNQRPVPGKRSGLRRVAMRHGVSRLRSGERYTVGVIFHDAV